MRLLIRTLMLLSCLLYAYMPAQAALSVVPAIGQTAHGLMVEKNGHGHHEPVAVKPALQQHVSIGDPCPHRGNIGHAAFCAACVVVIPQVDFAEASKMLYAYPHPDLGTAFVGNVPAPPLPPPRV